MKLRKIGTTSHGGNCPTLYETDSGDIVVQGDRLTDPEALSQLADVLPHEDFVVVPRALLTRFAPRSSVPDFVSGKEFDELFREYRHTAWRLETRTYYGVLHENEPFQKWLVGDDSDISWFKPWLRMMREELATGKRMERVRLIDDPPSDYLRWELWGTPYNLGAGEDIRYLPREHPIVADLPDFDYWVFDSRLSARLEFSDDGDVLGASLSEDPAEVLTALQGRDAAWHHALTFTEYMATRAE